VAAGLPNVQRPIVFPKTHDANRLYITFDLGCICREGNRWQIPAIDQQHGSTLNRRIRVGILNTHGSLIDLALDAAVMHQDDQKDIAIRFHEPIRVQRLPPIRRANYVSRRKNKAVADGGMNDETTASRFCLWPPAGVSTGHSQFDYGVPFIGHLVVLLTCARN
jgi:hypothetical protein